MRFCHNPEPHLPGVSDQWLTPERRNDEDTAHHVAVLKPIVKRRRENDMSAAGVPFGGLSTVASIAPSNILRFKEDESGLDIALTLLSNQTAGAPVVDSEGRYLGFINEFDVMRVLSKGEDISKRTAADIMRKDRLLITASTKLVDAAKMMQKHRVFNLPVHKDGVVVYSVSRHDLLRTWIGLGLGMCMEP
jgi:CBS domain-containing protein